MVAMSLPGRRRNQTVERNSFRSKPCRLRQSEQVPLYHARTALVSDIVRIQRGRKPSLACHGLSTRVPSFWIPSLKRWAVVERGTKIAHTYGELASRWRSSRTFMTCFRFCLCPAGTADPSPPIHRWVQQVAPRRSPAGAKDVHDTECMSRGRMLLVKSRGLHRPPAG